MPDLQDLHQKIKLSDSINGDGDLYYFTAHNDDTNHDIVISAIIIGIQMITKHCKRLKYQRRIVLVTDGRGPADPDQIIEITKKIKEEGIELIVM